MIDPATGTPVAEVARTPPDSLDSVLGRSVAAARLWSDSAVEQRRAAVRACAALPDETVERLATLLTAEQGKPIAQARAEARLAVDWFGWVAELPLADDQLDEAGGVHLRRAPYGVVAAISPFNYPLILSACKIAPALLAGNAVVLKPAVETPTAVSALVEAIEPHLPDDVLQVVHGGVDIGSALVSHPVVDKVSFTGSVAAGRTIAVACAEQLRSVTLELSGNDAAVALPGTDLDKAAEIFGAAMVNAGQFCSAAKRVLVPESDRAVWVERFTELAREMMVDPGCEPESELGPLTNAGQRDRVDTLVKHALELGARTTAGGAVVSGPGHFYAPRVVTDLYDAQTSLEMDEQFGPVPPVIGYDDLEQGIRRANSTKFGLGASVLGDAEDAERIAPSLVAGSVWTNKHADLRSDVPFGGHRESGMGVEYGFGGLLECSRIKVHNFS